MPSRVEWVPIIPALKEFWDNGLSAIEIAAKLQQQYPQYYFNKNVVIGKVHTLKLPARRRSTSAKKAPREVKVKPPKPSLNFKRKRMAPEDQPKPYVPVVVAHTTQVIALVDLTDKTCRWPIGEPNMPDFGFCGEPLPEDKTRHEVKFPYCAHHAQRARGRTKAEEAAE